jgi:hypothetical protein
VFEPLHFFQDVPQEQIEVCPTVTGLAPTGAWFSLMPSVVRNAIVSMPWTNTRKHRQLLIRPQDCRGVDTRLGTFWHRDVDVHGIVTPTWDDLILTIVSFGDVAGTQFIDPYEMLDEPPQSIIAPNLAHYTDADAQYVNDRLWAMKTIQTGLVVRYRSRDWHRAEPIQRPGWRLVMIGIESDHLEPRGGVVGR